MKKENEVMNEEIIDLEVYSQKGEKPPKGKKYKFKVKSKVYTVDVDSMTGREICVLAGLNPPENYILRLIMHGGATQEVGLDETVSFLTPGIERFLYVSRDQTEG